jgi:hypothetical protein
MSQENVVVVRKGIEALNRRDVPAARGTPVRLLSK